MKCVYYDNWDDDQDCNNYPYRDECYEEGQVWGAYTKKPITVLNVQTSINVNGISW